MKPRSARLEVLCALRARLKATSGALRPPPPRATFVSAKVAKAISAPRQRPLRGSPCPALASEGPHTAHPCAVCGLARIPLATLRVLASSTRVARRSLGALNTNGVKTTEASQVPYGAHEHRKPAAERLKGRGDGPRASTAGAGMRRRAAAMPQARSVGRGRAIRGKALLVTFGKTKVTRGCGGGAPRGSFITTFYIFNRAG